MTHKHSGFNARLKKAKLQDLLKMKQEQELEILKEKRAWFQGPRVFGYGKGANKASLMLRERRRDLARINTAINLGRRYTS